MIVLITKIFFLFISLSVLNPTERKKSRDKKNGVVFFLLWNGRMANAITKQPTKKVEKYLLNKKQQP